MVGDWYVMNVGLRDAELQRKCNRNKPNGSAPGLFSTPEFCRGGRQVTRFCFILVEPYSKSPPGATCMDCHGGATAWSTC